MLTLLLRNSGTPPGRPAGLFTSLSVLGVPGKPQVFVAKTPATLIFSPWLARQRSSIIGGGSL